VWSSRATTRAPARFLLPFNFCGQLKKRIKKNACQATAATASARSPKEENNEKSGEIICVDATDAARILDEKIDVERDDDNSSSRHICTTQRERVQRNTKSSCLGSCVVLL